MNEYECEYSNIYFFDPILCMEKYYKKLLLGKGGANEKLSAKSINQVSYKGGKNNY